MDYKVIPPAPESITAQTVLIRLIDGLAFRYYWATEGLTESNINFKPSESSMSTMELLEHLHQMAAYTNSILNQQKPERKEPINDFEVLRKGTLDLYSKTRNDLQSMSVEHLDAVRIQRRTEELPFWNLINGPIADALTHVGQITTWRRTDGNPVPKHNPFIGA